MNHSRSRSLWVLVMFCLMAVLAACGQPTAGSQATNAPAATDSVATSAPAGGATVSVALADTLTTNGTQTINIVGNPVPGGNYLLVGYNSIGGAGLGAFTLGSTPSQQPGSRPRVYTLDTTTAPGSCHSPRSTASSSRAILPISPTWLAARAVRSPPRRSSASSPKACRGRTWTSPARHT